MFSGDVAFCSVRDVTDRYYASFSLLYLLHVACNNNTVLLQYFSGNGRVMYGDGDVAQLVRESNRHAADAGSIPRCGKGFFS